MGTTLEDTIIKKKIMSSDPRDVGEGLLGEELSQIDDINGGRNSRVYVLTTNEEKKYVLKFYYKNKSDLRDRLRTEFSSLRFLWENKIKNISKPKAINDGVASAIYEFVEGEKINFKDLSEKDIDSAIDFLGKLKSLRGKKKAKDFSTASEACFSASEIIENLRFRLMKLMKVNSAFKEVALLTDFLNSEFTPFYADVLQWCQVEAQKKGISLDDLLDLKYRTLSSSDFGFHNSLKTQDGKNIFLDFEYFGWDDPAKIIVDFILHPAMELTEVFKKQFAKGVIRMFSEDKKLLDRTKLVYPLFGLKWCLIFLNEFTKDNLLRRGFAATKEIDKVETQNRQLAKAKLMLSTVKSNYKNFHYGK